MLSIDIYHVSTQGIYDLWQLIFVRDRFLGGAFLVFLVAIKKQAISHARIASTNALSSGWENWQQPWEYTKWSLFFNFCFWARLGAEASVKDASFDAIQTGDISMLEEMGESTVGGSCREDRVQLLPEDRVQWMIIHIEPESRISWESMVATAWWR